MSFIPQTGSTVAFQGNPSLLQATVGLNSTNASVITVGSPVANQSISGTVGASVIGHAPVVIVGGSILTSSTANQSVSGTVGASIIGAPPANVFVGGALATTANPLPVSPPASGFFPVILNTSTNASVITVGSPVANQSVSGTVDIGNFPTTQNISGSVVSFQGGAWTTSVVGTVGASIIGTVPVTQSGTRITSVIGSVTALQGTNPWLTTLSASTNSSVLVRIQANSVAGTYAEDTAHTSGANGLFVLGVRNDTLASVTSANGDYSAMAQGPSARLLFQMLRSHAGYEVQQTLEETLEGR